MLDTLCRAPSSEPHNARKIGNIRGQRFNTWDFDLPCLRGNWVLAVGVFSVHGFFPACLPAVYGARPGL